MTTKIIVKATGEKKTAVYADNKGKMLYNVDGKFYSDKKFNELFGIIPAEGLVTWKVHVRNLFDEILQYNDTTHVFKQPFQIFICILAEAAKVAVDEKNEIMIGHFCRLGLYDFADPTNKEHYDEDATNYYINKTS